jgi:hypothetical protein
MLSAVKMLSIARTPMPAAKIQRAISRFALVIAASASAALHAALAYAKNVARGIQWEI